MIRAEDRVGTALDRLTRLHPKSIDLTLDRMWRLLDALGNPQNHLAPTVHIAGTNGKGSVAAYICAAISDAGYRVHVYTSPHLVYFNERIRLNGTLIEDDVLADLLEEVEDANAGRVITFFEITTAAALLAFSRIPADLLILETGLGGRLDATNVISHPAASVITPIALDHQSYLGNTLKAIAYEKAGIFRTGTPVFSAKQPDLVEQVLRDRAAALNAPFAIEGKDWNWEKTDKGFEILYKHCLPIRYPAPALPGKHQMSNATLADAVLRQLERVGFETDVSVRAKAFSRSVSWPARMQKLDQGNLPDLMASQTESLWLDGGHNPHAGTAIAEHVASWAHEGPVDMIGGMIETKDTSGYLCALAPYIRRFYAVPVQGGMTGNGIAASDLVLAAKAAGMDRSYEAADVLSALKEIARNDPPKRILIAGSLYLAGQVLDLNATPPE